MNDTKGGIVVTGKVKWFNNAAGWGFITPEHEEKDIFVHYSAMSDIRWRTLVAGQTVNFELKNGKRGIYAINVVVLII